MKRVISLSIASLFVLLLCSRLQAGQPAQARIDSMLSVVKIQNNDTNKVNTLNELAWEFFTGSYDYKRSMECAEEALALAKRIRFKKGEATAYRRLGGIDMNKGLYNEAMKVYTEELKIQQELGDQKRMAASFMQVGSVYFYIANYPMALENYIKGLKIAEEIKDRISISKISNNVGKVYCNTGDYTEALKYYSEALKIYEDMGDKEGVAKECCGIGDIYYSQKNYENAILYFNKSLKISEENGMKRMAATCYIDLGESYTAMGKYNEALQNQLEGLKISEEINDQYITVHIKKSLGWTYYSLHKWDESRKYLNEALAKAKEIRLIEGIEICYYRLSKLDSVTGNFKSSFQNYKQYVLYRDSILNGENTQKITQQKMQIEFDKTQKLEKAEQARKDLRQRIIRYAILAGLILVTAFLLIVFRQRNKIRREKKISDKLLLNILPAEVAEEIKRDGHSKAKSFSMVTVMLTDFKDFTMVSEQYSAEELVAEIDHCFSAFDKIIRRHGVEKIKTIGDAYMCVGGIPVQTTTHAIDVVNAAIEIRNFMAERKKEQDAISGISFELRLGIHSGPLVAGIVGLNKYAYDIWGNTVNLAARMEQNSEAGKINISGSTYQLVKDKFNCVYRGMIEVKNGGEEEMYFVE
jgi:adenylate cyclase